MAGFDLFKAFSTDKRAESEGRKMVLRPATADQKESYLLIARKGNANYKAFMGKVLTENQNLLNTKTAEAEAVANAIFKDAAARFLLIGWGGIAWKGEDDVQYSASLAQEMFAEAEDFYQLVEKFASEMSNYRAEEVAKDAKNSATS